MNFKFRPHLGELRFWTMTCGCQNPAIHWSSEFNARMCQNCGVLMVQEDGTPIEDRLPKPENMNGYADQFGGEDFPSDPGNISQHTVQPNQTFVHLRVHTHYSFLKATCKPDDIIKKAKEDKQPAIAKTEFGNMCGTPTFVKKCLDEGIKPIIGTEFDIKYTNEQLTYPVTLIALNRDGYKSLVKLNTVAWCDRKDKKEVFLLHNDIMLHHKGLIALVDVYPNFELASFVVQSLKSLLPTYVEVNKDDSGIKAAAQQIATTNNVKIVVTGNVLYTSEEDKYAYGLALKIGKHAHDYHLPPEIDNWFKPSSSFGTLGSNFPQEWVDRTVEIANQVEDYGIVNKEFIVPTYKEPGKEYTDFGEVHRKLEMEAWKGLYQRGKAEQQEYIDRLQYELGVMKEKKFSSYFLLIAEIIGWMKSHNILPPIGRGSSVGSLVCYALSITSIDPIRWNVPFERFIHSGRKDLPDIDTDISQERRGDVLKHIADIHGGDKVAQIATFQTMALKAAIDNTGRALQLPYSTNRDIRKLVPDDISDIKDLKEDVIEMMSYKEGWIDAVKSLHGVAKNIGFHAAGVVISNEPLADLVPLLPSAAESGGLIGIQYDMHDCEILGLLKLDMLGLRNLDIIQKTLNNVKERHGNDIDIYNLPPNDPKTYDLISKAKFVSVFQLDSTGYRRLCRQLGPGSFEHIMALNALFRPGPLESGVTEEYVERRHGKQAAVSWHPWLDSVLSDTYQTVLFQEQAMAMSRIIAGFSDEEADKFRKGIGKKIPEVVEACLKDFREGAMKMPGLTVPPGYTGTLEQWVAELVKKLHGYARYMWNRGHSAGYGWITYITAYLESHYPHEYYIALLDSYNKPSRLAALIRSILSVKLCRIVPPHVNESVINYSIGSDNNIYMGLAAIRSVGKAADEIIKERMNNGRFTSFIQFCQRMPSVNKTIKINLVKSGAFSWDKMLCDRDKIDSADVIQKWTKKRTKKYDGSKVTAYEIAMKLEQIEGHDFTEIERNKNEREVLHSFITGHPAAVYQQLSFNLERGNTRIVVPSQVYFDEDGSGGGCEEGETVLVVGMVDFVNRKMTREKVDENGRVKYPSKPFITVSISDNEGYTITNIWHPLCDEIQKILVEGEVAMFECIVKKDKFRDDFVSLHVKTAINLANGLPIQGVFRLNGHNPEEIVQKIGGMVQQTSGVGPRKFSSIRGRISVMPDILDKVVKECGDDISYLVSMDALST